MKFSIPAKDLKRALSTCNEIAPVSSAIAEEKTGVLIRARGEAVVFMSADETSYVSVTVPAQVKIEGEALVRCSAVSGSVSATFLEDGKTITVETTDKESLKISGVSTVKHNRTFPLLNAGFFVETPEFDEAQAARIEALALQDGILAVAHAASKDASKLHFNCVSTTFTDNEVVFAATDGVQIAEFRQTVKVPKQGLRGSFILGLKFANVMAKYVADVLREGDTEGRVGIYVEKDHFFLRSGGTVLVGTLLNTSFPDYVEHLETTEKLLAIFPIDESLSVLAGMQPTVDTKSHRMVVDASNSGQAVLSNSSNSGASESSELPIQTAVSFVLHFDALLFQTAIRQLAALKKRKENETDFEFYFTENAAHVILKLPKHDYFKTLVCTLKPVS